MLGFLFKNKDSKPPVENSNSTLNVIDLIPKSPSPESRIDLFNEKDILESQRDLVDKISLGLGFDKKNKECLIEDVVMEFIKYTHLLPASESHHHCEPAGLLRHSLEVAFYSVNLSTVSTFAVKESVEYRNGASSAYPYATFLAGLFHDLGKAFYDVKVISPSTGKENNPFTTNIYEFLESTGDSSYVYRFNKNRIHKFHEMISLTFFTKLLSEDAFNYLTSYGVTKEVFFNLVLAMSDKEIDEAKYGLDAKILRDILLKADQRSVKRFMQGSISLFGQDGRPLNKDELLIKLINHSVDIGELDVNKLESNLFYLDSKYLFIVLNQNFIKKINRVATEIEANIPDTVEAMKDFFNKSKISIGDDGDIVRKIQININSKKITFTGVLLDSKNFQSIIDGEESLAIHVEDTQPKIKSTKGNEPLVSGQEKGSLHEGSLEDLIADEKDKPVDNLGEELTPNNEINVIPKIDKLLEIDSDLISEKDDLSHDDILDEKPDFSDEEYLDTPLSDDDLSSQELTSSITPQGEDDFDIDMDEDFFQENDESNDQVSERILSILIENGKEGVSFSVLNELVKDEFQLSLKEARQEIMKMAEKQSGKYVLKEGVEI